MVRSTFAHIYIGNHLYIYILTLKYKYIHKKANNVIWCSIKRKVFHLWRRRWWWWGIYSWCRHSFLSRLVPPLHHLIRLNHVIMQCKNDRICNSFHHHMVEHILMLNPTFIFKAKLLKQKWKDPRSLSKYMYNCIEKANEWMIKINVFLLIKIQSCTIFFINIRWYHYYALDSYLKPTCTILD